MFSVSSVSRVFSGRLPFSRFVLSGFWHSPFLPNHNIVIVAGNEYTRGGSLYIVSYCSINIHIVLYSRVHSRSAGPATLQQVAQLTWRHARPRGQSSASPAACPCSLPALHSSLASLVALPPPAHPCSAPPTSSSQVSLWSQLSKLL